MLLFMIVTKSPNFLANHNISVLDFANPTQL